MTSRSVSVSIRIACMAPVLLSLFLLVPLALAQPRAVVNVEAPQNAPLGTRIEIPILIDSITPGQSFRSFDLKFYYDPSALRIDSILPGLLLNNCQWHLFTYELVATPPSFGSPATAAGVHIYASGDSLSLPPVCAISSSGELARLFVTTSSNPSWRCSDHLFAFYWTDCGDNSFMNSAGPDTLFLSDKVYDKYGLQIDQDGPLNTFRGSPNTCLQEPPGEPFKLRAVNYRSSTLRVICAEDTLSSGALVVIPNEFAVVGGTVKVPVILDKIAANLQFAGFDLLLQYDHTALAFQSASLGPTLDSCGWEYFGYRSGGSGACGQSPCPDSMVRVVAIADVNNGPGHPSCYTSPGATLAYLQFGIPDDQSLVDRFFPISWIWRECGDNSFANIFGDTFVVSRTVYDQQGFPLPPDTAFPNFTGALDECLITQHGTPLRLVDFQPGGVYVYEGSPIDARGDINQNGIANEIADYVLLVNYLYFGTRVFTINPRFQLLASDVNNNGLNGTAADLYYLYRIIIGNAPPIPKIAPRTIWDTAFFAQDTVNKTVSMQYADTVHALYMIFKGEVIPAQGTYADSVKSYFDTTYTKVLILPSLLPVPSPVPEIPNGLLFSYTGAGELVAVQVASDGVTDPPTVIQGSSQTNCCAKRGNVDGSPGGIVDISDVSTLIDYLFGSGQLPLFACWEEANVDGNGGIDISDVQALVDYLFFGVRLRPCAK
jgi:hypothetical protein